MQSEVQVDEYIHLYSKCEMPMKKPLNILVEYVYARQFYSQHEKSGRCLQRMSDQQDFAKKGCPMFS